MRLTKCLVTVLFHCNCSIFSGFTADRKVQGSNPQFNSMSWMASYKICQIVQIFDIFIVFPFIFLNNKLQ